MELVVAEHGRKPIVEIEATNSAEKSNTESTKENTTWRHGKLCLPSLEALIVEFDCFES